MTDPESSVFIPRRGWIPACAGMTGVETFYESINFNPRNTLMGHSLKSNREKTLVAAICILGISGVAYGMIEKNHPIFVLGICIVAGGYLLIRRRLKDRVKSLNSHDS